MTTELNFREQLVAVGRMAIKAAPFFYMGVRGAVAEVADREAVIAQLMALTGAPYPQCAKAVADYAEGMLYPNWQMFIETATEAIVYAYKHPASKEGL